MQKLIISFFGLAALIFSCGESDIERNKSDFYFESFSYDEIGIVYSFKFLNDGIIYATATNGLHKSSDNGDSWITLINDSNNPKDVMLTNSGSLILDVNGYVLYKSYDHGDTWLVDSLALGEQMDFSAMDEYDIIYMSSYKSNYVYFAQNDFTEWDSVYFEYTIRSIERVNDNIFVICSNDNEKYHLFVNDPNVLGFKKLTAFDKFPSSFSKSNLSNSDQIFVITEDEIFSLNTVNGQTNKINTPNSVEGYSSGYSDIILTENNDIYLYQNVSYPAEIYPSIVYKSKNNGEQWTRLKEPKGEYIYDMKMSPQKQLFISTHSRKIFRSSEVIRK
jgi:hypothetical protein